MQGIDILPPYRPIILPQFSPYLSLHFPPFPALIARFLQPCLRRQTRAYQIRAHQVPHVLPRTVVPLMAMRGIAPAVLAIQRISRTFASKFEVTIVRLDLAAKDGRLIRYKVIIRHLPHVQASR